MKISKAHHLKILFGENYATSMKQFTPQVACSPQCF
jgi:hypothetical protein